ncbi:MAG TPA: peroxide stress protein YaaA [Solirubrobacteraceae bacterium]|nr:peroxide stress protein YaaA [Solirubrobacteraceae bacterium]
MLHGCQTTAAVQMRASLYNPLAGRAGTRLASPPVLVLLAPSRGKASPERGRRAGMSTLVYPRLREPRERLIDAVDPDLRTAPAIPAVELYTGVLFAALGLGDLPWDSVLIASALWGVVRPGDRIPSYRLDIGDRPAGIGGLAAYWREPLRTALPDRGLVLDLRSGAYAAAWQPRRATRLAVRGFTEAPDGTRSVITHMVKRVRGEVARLVLQAGGAERPEQVAEIAAAGGLRVELSDGHLDVIE